MNKILPIRLLTVITLSLSLCPFGIYGCAPHGADSDRDNSGATSSDNEPIAAVAWSPDSDCASCHIAEQAAQVACLSDDEASCGTCHTSEGELAAVHEKAGDVSSMPKRLKSTSIDDEVCLSCHYETVENLIENTPSISPLVDDNGNEANPHAALAAEHHADADLHCSSCHNPHSEKEPLQQAQKACLSCHHANVYECYTCHE